MFTIRSLLASTKHPFTRSIAQVATATIRKDIANMADNSPLPTSSPAPDPPASSAAPDAPTSISSDNKPPKSKKELAKEAKAAKFAAKQQQAKQVQPKVQKPKQPAPTTTLAPFKDDTPPGEKKKIVPFEDPYFQSYNPKAVEAGWYAWWETQGFFQPNPKASKSQKFVVPLPPPNVTGALHCGHALANSLQDTLVRWYRMRGFDTLWVPGCDHAGISTQSVVEKMLWKKRGATRLDLGREEFTKLVWEWKEDYHARINQTQKRMGGSMDWSREAFTMDQNLTAATMENFCRLHDEGLIYRSDRLVNWCSHLQTALSGLEVETKDIAGRTLLDVPSYTKKVEFGVMTHFQYPIDGSDDNLTIEVATTRPETMLGDTGIAVNPDDSRYTHLVGKYARHPFNGRLLKIVADSYVDAEFGTGAVKLTPAHDLNDYQLGQRHGLEFINILNGDGTLNENAGPDFQGQKRFDARYTVVEELKKLGLFVKKESHAMTIPLCEKSKDVIEPRMQPQWWVQMKDMADAALEAVNRGDIKIAPESAHKSYQRWMSNVSDWCISRQLWWGHRIPAYRVIFEGEGDQETKDSHWIVAPSAAEATTKAQTKFPSRQFRLEQDPDCLDTWFSSGLWPMAILGWPDVEKADFKRFFPTSLLETGWDILFFWVARMIMLSLKLTGSVPFSEVYCHSLVRDSEGRKMSKSLGNVIDPLDIIDGIELEALHGKLGVGNLKDDEVSRAIKFQKQAFPQGIPECGADALRFTLLSYTTGGGDINFDIRVMHAYRRFCNKIWQASKYVLGKLPSGFVPDEASPALSVPERWILYRMNSAVKGINDALEAREFSKSTKFAYQYFYDELCDVFIEISKDVLSQGTPEEQHSMQQSLYQTLDTALRLLHPFMPYITEELWQRLPSRPGQGSRESESATGARPPSIMLASYPAFDARIESSNESDAKDFELVLKCAQGLRSLASEYGVRSGGIAFIKTSTTDDSTKASDQARAVGSLCGKTIAELKVLGPTENPPGGCAVFVISSELSVLLQVSDRISDKLDAEMAKIRAKIDKNADVITRQQKLIAQEGFEKVSDVVQDAEKTKLANALSAAENYRRTLDEFAKLGLGQSN
ncbi:mitochondrial valyl-tRNA synthetase [Xylariaceae sp. FL0255]|nr:mitochondrial valyl-tRNA synthetase [Xylariaceae sp. FL0255]